MALHVTHGWRDLPPELMGAAVALGAFDGVHRGHRKVLALAAEAAARLKAPLGAISFEPHPRRYFGRETEPFRLMTVDQQARALDELGVERFYLLPFDEEMAAFSDERFAEMVLARGLGAVHVSAGFDISFGAGRTGSPDRLRAFGERFGFGVSIAEAVQGRAGEKFSSSAVRAALREGRPEEALMILGRPFAVEGVVVGGGGLGGTVGVPTANVALGDYVRLRPGVYATRTRLADGREIAGVGCVTAGTGHDGGARVQVHLLDFDEDIIGETIETHFIHFLREERLPGQGGDRRSEGLRDAAQARALLLPEL